jgi:hypothetical protein
MPIDTDILSFGELNNNVTDINTKVTPIADMVLNPVPAGSNNKIAIRRGSVWKIEGEEAYNGQFQELGNISGNIELALNATSSRTAILATVTGNTFVTSFGTNMATNHVYTIYLKQNSIGNHSVRWPYGASILGMVLPAANQITEIYAVKFTNGKIFIKCTAFQNISDAGFVIKEFELPVITFPDGGQAPMTFTWTKAAPIGHGGTVTDLYSDWEIAQDALYTNLLFSSYGNTIDLSSIQVVLMQAGTAYMRTRYGGIIGGDALVSPWDEAAVEFSGIDGDRYWDQVVLCINANKYGWEGSRKIVDEKCFNILTIAGDTKVTDSSGKWAINFDGSGDYLSVSASVLNELKSGDFTFEFFAEFSNITTQQVIWSKGCDWGFAGGQILYVYTNGKLSWGFANSSGTAWQFQTDQTSLGLSLATSNTLYHLAFVRSGNSLKMFVNGTLGISRVVTSDHNDTSAYPLVFGTDRDFSGAPQSPMKIYGIRLTKNIARYTSDFNVDLTNPYFKTGNLWWTPKPIEIATDKFVDSANWDKVVLCTNFYGVTNSTSFIDELGGTLVAYGDAKIGVANNLSYVNFDGSGDYVNSSLVPGAYFGNTNWCFEVFVSATGSGVILSDAISNGGYYFFRMDYDSVNGRFFVFVYDSSSVLITLYTANSSVVSGNIYHLAIVRSGTNLRLFLNGTLADTQTITVGRAVYSSGSVLKLGVYGTGTFLTGKVYSLRVSHYDRYTANFTSPDLTRPYFPTKPKVQNWADTSLLINAIGLETNSTDIRDQKGSVVSVFGDAKVAVDSSGNSYINFDGSGDYLYVGNAGDFNFLHNGLFVWTLEFLFNPSAVDIDDTIFDTCRGTGNNSGISILFSGASGRLRFFIANGSSIVTDKYFTEYTFVVGTLYHIALTYDHSLGSDNVKLFVNGLQTAVATKGGGALSPNNCQQAMIGGFSASYPAMMFNGKLYSFRITKGKALYTSNFYVDTTNPYFPAIDSISDSWWDGLDYSSLTLNSSEVTGWKDKSYNNKNFAKDTLTGPTYSDDGLAFSGGQGLLVPNSTGMFNFLHHSGGIVLAVIEVGTSANPAVDYAIVGNNLGATAWRGFYLGYGDASPANNCLACHVNNGSANQFVAGSYSSSHNAAYNNIVTPQVETQVLAIVEPLNATIIERYKASSDGAVLVVANNCTHTASASDASLNFCVGAIKGSGVWYNHLVGKIKEVVIIKGSLSYHVLQNIQGFFAHKWGLTDNLPATHPYKTGFPTEDTRTDDYWYATVLCINATDIIKPTEIIDSRRMNKITVFGDTKTLIDTNNKPYISFDGTSDCIHFPFKDFGFGSADFTVEWFVEFSGWNPNSSRLWNANGDVYHEFDMNVQPTGILACYASSTGIIWDMVSNTNIAQLVTNTLYHIAVVRFGSNFYAFVNGVRYTLSTTLGTTVLFANLGSRSIGGQSTGPNRSLSGKIYSTRVTKGIARYTENFDVDLTNPYFPKKANYWTPAQITGAVWVDANNATLNGSAITALTDKAWGIIQATQGTPTNQPTLVADVLAGEPVIQFDGNDFLSFGTLLGKPANWTVFVVGMFASQPSISTMCGSGESTGLSAHCWGFIGAGRTANDNKLEWQFGNGSNYSWGRSSTPVITNNNWFFCCRRYTSGQTIVVDRVNGSSSSVTQEFTGASTTAGTPYSFALGRMGDFNGVYLTNGSRLKGFVCVPSAISNADAERLEGYYAHLCGLASLLPSNHPYKLSPPTY